MKHHYAWVTILGKVFVPDWAITSLQEGAPLALDEKDAFEQLARDAISETYEQSDEPVKVCNVAIDMTTFH